MFGAFSAAHEVQFPPLCVRFCIWSLSCYIHSSPTCQTVQPSKAVCGRGCGAVCTTRADIQSGGTAVRKCHVEARFRCSIASPSSLFSWFLNLRKYSELFEYRYSLWYLKCSNIRTTLTCTYCSVYCGHTFCMLHSHSFFFFCLHTRNVNPCITIVCFVFPCFAPTMSTFTLQSRSRYIWVDKVYHIIAYIEQPEYPLEKSRVRV